MKNSGSSKSKRNETRVIVNTKREVVTYAELWHSSECLLRKGQEQEEASTHQFRASLVFTAFSLEAALNHLGSKLFKCWPDIESLSPTKKLNLLAEHLDVSVDYSGQPWQIMKDLFGFRNDIAHGKSTTLERRSEESWEEFNANPFFTLTKWEAFCTEDNAKRGRANVEEIVRHLYAAAKAKGCNAGGPFDKGTEVGSTHALGS